MRRVLVFIFMIFGLPLFSFDKLPESYLVSYGTPEAKIKAVQYFSFMCPFCLELYKRDFEEIKARYIESDSIAYTFHPVPKDLLTVSAMDCLEKLNSVQKKAFLEVMLEEIDPEDVEYSIGLMKKAMEILGIPIPRLNEKEYLQSTKAFKEAFGFLSQEETISAVPAVELNGRLYPKEIPDLAFMDSNLGKLTNLSKTTLEN